MNNKHERIAAIEQIQTKAYQLDSVSLIAQEGRVQELNSERIEYLFGLIGELSRDIANLADFSLNLEDLNA